MVDTLAVLANEIAHLKIAHAENVERIEYLEAYKAKAEKYGWFCMGIVAVGVYVASNIDNAIKFMTKVAP